MPITAPGFRAASITLATAATVASLVLAACEERQPHLPDYMGVALNDTDMRHPISFVDRLEVLNVDAPPHGHGISHNQSADMHRFVARYKAEGAGRLTVSVPSGGTGASQVVTELGRILREADVAPARVVRTRHADGSRLRPAVRLSYAAPHAIPPACGHWHRDVARDPERLNYPEFGCATQRNLAGMVANARDLQRPQDEQPRSAERRSQTWSKYIAPEEDNADVKAKAEETTKK